MINLLKPTFYIIVIYGLCISTSCGSGGADFSEKLGNGYYYYRNSSIDCFIAPKTWDDKTPIIPSRVIQHKSNGRYVTAQREIVKISEVGSRVGSGVFDFWILDTEIPRSYGPLSEDEFNTQFRLLGLPDALTLQ